MEPEGLLPYLEVPATCSYPEPDQSSPTSWRSILILSSPQGLGLPSDLFPSGFPTKILYSPLPHSATCPAHLICLDFITLGAISTDY